MPRGKRGKGGGPSFYSASTTGGGGGSPAPETGDYPAQPVLSEGSLDNGPGTGAMPSIYISNVNQATATAINEAGPGNATNSGGNNSSGGGGMEMNMNSGDMNMGSMNGMNSRY